MKKRKKKVEKFEEWCDRVLTLLRNVFYVKEYEWKLRFNKEGDTKQEQGYSNSTAAYITIDVKYLNYAVTIFPVVKEKYERGDYRGCFGILVHEMSHIYTEPLYLFAIDAVTNTSKEYLETVREQQTQRIAGCVQELVPYAKYKPKCPSK